MIHFVLQGKEIQTLERFSEGERLTFAANGNTAGASVTAERYRRRGVSEIMYTCDSNESHEASQCIAERDFKEEFQGKKRQEKSTLMLEHRRAKNFKRFHGSKVRSDTVALNFAAAFLHSTIRWNPGTNHSNHKLTGQNKDSELVENIGTFLDTGKLTLIFELFF